MKLEDKTAMVDLDGGIRIMTGIVECASVNIKLDMDVEVVFEDISEECVLQMYKPVK